MTSCHDCNERPVCCRYARAVEAARELIADRLGAPPPAALTSSIAIAGAASVPRDRPWRAKRLPIKGLS